MKNTKLLYKKSNVRKMLYAQIVIFCFMLAGLILAPIPFQGSSGTLEFNSYGQQLGLMIMFSVVLSVYDSYIVRPMISRKRYLEDFKIGSYAWIQSVYLNIGTEQEIWFAHISALPSSAELPESEPIFLEVTKAFVDEIKESDVYRKKGLRSIQIKFVSSKNAISERDLIDGVVAIVLSEVCDKESGTSQKHDTCFGEDSESKRFLHDAGINIPEMPTPVSRL